MSFAREKNHKIKIVDSSAEIAKGYWNVSAAMTNPEGMGASISAAYPYLARCGARFVCRDLQADVRERTAGHLTVIVELEPLAAAQASFSSPPTLAFHRRRRRSCRPLTSSVGGHDARRPLMKCRCCQLLIFPSWHNAMGRDQFG